MKLPGSLFPSQPDFTIIKRMYCSATKIIDMSLLITLNNFSVIVFSITHFCSAFFYNQLFAGQFSELCVCRIVLAAKKECSEQSFVKDILLSSALTNPQAAFGQGQSCSNELHGRNRFMLCSKPTKIGDWNDWNTYWKRLDRQLNLMRIVFFFKLSCCVRLIISSF